MRVRPAKEKDVLDLLGVGLREADALECRRLFGRDPALCLWDGYLYSDICFAAEESGEVFALGGVMAKSMLSGGGIAWLLGTDKLDSVWYSFAKESRRVSQELVREYGVLENFVDATNTKTIRWLEWLGFSIGETTLSPLGHPFRKFWRRNVQSV